MLRGIFISTCIRYDWQARNARGLSVFTEGVTHRICSMRSPLTSLRTKVSGFMESPSPHQCTYVIDPEQSVSASTPFSASSVGM